MRVIYISKEMPKKFGVRVIHYVRVIYRKIRHALYLYIKRKVEKVLGCALYIRCALYIEKYVMRVFYTSKGMSKKFGVCVIH